MKKLILITVSFSLFVISLFLLSGCGDSSLNSLYIGEDNHGLIGMAPGDSCSFEETKTTGSGSCYNSVTLTVFGTRDSYGNCVPGRPSTWKPNCGPGNPAICEFCDEDCNPFNFEDDNPGDNMPFPDCSGPKIKIWTFVGAPICRYDLDTKCSLLCFEVPKNYCDGNIAHMFSFSEQTPTCYRELKVDCSRQGSECKDGLCRRS